MDQLLKDMSPLSFLRPKIFRRCSAFCGLLWRLPDIQISAPIETNGIGMCYLQTGSFSYGNTKKKVNCRKLKTNIIFEQLTSNRISKSHFEVGFSSINFLANDQQRISLFESHQHKSWSAPILGSIFLCFQIYVQFPICSTFCGLHLKISIAF